MPISQNSPFMRIPIEHETKEVYLLDGIRFFSTLCNRSYSKLERCLLKIQGDGDIATLILTAFDETWRIIDYSNKLYILTDESADFKTLEEFKGFENHRDAIYKMKNSFQHLNGKLQNIISKKIPITGELSWRTNTDDRKFKYAKYSITYGCHINPEMPFDLSLSKLKNNEIKEVEIHAFGETLNLSQLINDMHILIKIMEKKLNTIFSLLDSNSVHDSSKIKSLFIE